MSTGAWAYKLGQVENRATGNDKVGVKLLCSTDSISQLTNDFGLDEGVNNPAFGKCEGASRYYNLCRLLENKKDKKWNIRSSVYRRERKWSGRIFTGTAP